MLHTKFYKKRTHIHQKTPLKSRPQLASILEPTWLHFGKVLGAMLGQLGTKSLQKPVHKIIRKMITICVASGSVFGRFWGPTWRPKMAGFRPKWGDAIKHQPFSVGLLLFWFHLGAKMIPGTLQDRPPQDPLQE